MRAGRVGAFNALFRRQVVVLQEQPGLLWVKLARRLHADGSQEAVLFEEWEDASSLYGWVGPNLTEPRLIPGIRELVDEVSVAHYESLAEDVAEELEESTDGGSTVDLSGLNGQPRSPRPTRASPAAPGVSDPGSAPGRATTD